MSRATLALSLVAAALATCAAPAAAKVRVGPAGNAFYTPPSKPPKGTHGTPIWARAVTDAAKLTSARSNRVLLYRSTGVTGKPVAVSGLVSIPKGKAPNGGWPVVTWAHGTSGIADQCAPSRDTANGPAHLLNAYIEPLLNSWLKRGYAVVRTDYEGLGTPGDHPYLIGNSEGRSVLDMVRAARKLDPRISKRVVIAGHSQGGQAALFAAALARSFTPELQIRGTIAFAPVSHLSEQIPIARSIKDPSPITGFGVMIARGLQLAQPSLNIPSLLSDRTAPLFHFASESCLVQLLSDEEFGKVSPSEIFRSDADFGPVTKALDKLDDAENLKIRTPVRIEQGTADTTVLPVFTGQLASDLSKRGTKLVYRTYDKTGHGDVVTKAAKDSTAWLRTRLRR